MARRTLASVIRKNKSEYYRLMAFEARENEQIHHMKKRIKLLAEDEKNSLALQVYLTSVLAQVQQQKTELEQAAPSKEGSKTLKRVEKEFKEIDKKHKRNAYHLAVLETKKEKDNVARLILKEAKRDEIRVRAQAAYTVWKQFEQLLQQENADNEVVAICQTTASEIFVIKQTADTESTPRFCTSENRLVLLSARANENTFVQYITSSRLFSFGSPRFGQHSLSIDQLTDKDVCKEKRMHLAVL